MTNPRIILNELKWRKKYDIKNAEIFYIHRGAPNNTKKIYGEELLDIGKSFMQTHSGFIPYHRILKITYEGKNMFKR